jgi:uncharacterized membrane protein
MVSLMRKYKEHLAAFGFYAGATYLTCLLIGTMVGFAFPWDWHSGSHELARALALFAGVVGVYHVWRDGL